MAARSAMAAWGFRLGILGLVLAAAGVAVSRMAPASFQIALGAVAFGAVVGVLAILVSAAGLLMALVTGRKGARKAIVGLVLGLGIAAPVAQGVIVGSQVPRIHDITTDLADPPQFAALKGNRGDYANPLDRTAPADLAALQETAYPDIRTVTINMAPARVFDAALATARDMGWEIVDTDPDAGRIEATATTLVMQFRDDVAIRVSQTQEGGSAVDMRSVSRVGQSDLGANANRIRTFMVALKQKLGFEK
ncbi:hypothetical protein FHS78_002876 [Parvibaculum indicum]|uniref:DUF1499 domain-containing protein n=1 Tax=Parvibaculum indicum TaxID=562969 RepID=UPI00141E9F9C|nr:DUF1499 domain-containing protein [Parvibaculum indicum]NIJ42574.1 hypothetical protein [Parvibaculum indicum]